MAARKALIEVDGQKYNATYIGKGTFSRVFRVGDRVVYYTRGDCTKEVITMFLYDRITHIPEMVRHENLYTSRENKWYVFSSPFYRNVKASDTSAWKLMKRLISAHYIEVSRLAGRVGRYDGSMMHTLIDRMEEEKEYKLPHSIIKAMRVLAEIGGNCGDNIRFDFHKKNFGVNEYGTLIFRDPMYVL